MKNLSILNRLISQTTDESYGKQKIRLIVQVLVLSSLVIFLLETFLMVFLEFILVIPEPLVVYIDGFILILFLFPINYYFIVRPLARQIDEHYLTNRELTKSNEILERFFLLSDILIAYMDSDFNFLRVNKAYSLTDERDPEEFVGKNHFDLFPNEENREIFETVVRTGKPYYAVEKPFEYADHPERGVTYWDWSLLPVRDPDGSVVELILVLNNVTERKKAQNALVESERRFRAVFNQTFQHSVLLDPDGTVMLVNQTALNFARTTPENLVGIPVWDLFWWDTATPSYADLANQLEDAVHQASLGSIVRQETRIISSSGQRAMMDITIKPVYDEQERTIFLIYEARDITDRIRAEQAIKRSEGKIKRLYLAEKNAHLFAETLRSAVLALSKSLNSDIVLGTLLDHLSKMVNYTSAHILVLDDEEHLVVRIARGDEEWLEEDSIQGKRFHLEQMQFFIPLMENKETISVPDTLLYKGAIFTPQHAFVRSWLGIPLLAGEQVIGICLLEHKCPGFFSKDLVHWATALTGQAAVAIQNAWLFGQVRDGREQLQALSRRLVDVQEQERHYIARELHDESGQALASMMIGLRQLEQESSDPVKVVARSRELKQVADGVLENLHRLAANLRPATLDHLGLVAAIKQHAQAIRSQHHLNIEFATVGKIDRLPGEVETAIYRILQESLTNVVRHAKATQVDILLERRNNALVVIVEDNGIGFDPQNIHAHQLGVLGMRERAEMLNGVISIESVAGRGTTIILEVPCQFEY